MFISPNPTPADNNALRVAERMHPVALSLNDGNRGRDERGDAVREQTVLVAKKMITMQESENLASLSCSGSERKVRLGKRE